MIFANRLLATKPPVIEAILADSPGREFILVRDSSEAYPEIYGDIEQRHPSQIKAILIRDVTGDKAEVRRYQDGAFKRLLPDLRLVFQDTGEAAAFLAGRV